MFGIKCGIFVFVLQMALEEGQETLGPAVVNSLKVDMVPMAHPPCCQGAHLPTSARPATHPPCTFHMTQWFVDPYAFMFISTSCVRFGMRWSFVPDPLPRDLSLFSSSIITL